MGETTHKDLPFSPEDGTMSEYIVRETGYPGAVKQEVVGELVRCKECKHRPSGDGANHNIEFPDDLCPCQCEDFWYSWIPSDDWFCADGERRE